ncbi:MAG: radical SAM protein [Planctomycetota bacterium]
MSVESHERADRADVVFLRVDAPSDRAGPNVPGAAAPAAILGAASAVRDRARPNARLDVAFMDREVERWSEQDAAHRALALRPDVVVLGTETRDTAGESPGGAARPRPGTTGAPDLVSVGKRVATLGDAAGGAGGPLRVALIPADTGLAEGVLATDGADLVLRGEPDEGLPALVREATGGRSEWSGFRGVSWRDDAGSVRHEEEAEPPRSHATPAWDLVDLSRYGDPGARRLPLLGRLARGTQAPAVTIVTSRVCTPDCPTCHGSFGAQVRDRSVGDVAQEIRGLVRDGGVRTLRIGDHAFDGRPARALRVAREIAELRATPGREDLVVAFPRGLRGDGLTDELVDALVDAGVRRFPLRVGTASPRLQRLLKTNVHLGRVRRALERIASRGAIGHLELRLAMPTETTGEAAHTMRWARESAAHTATFLPGRDLDLGQSLALDRSGEDDDFRNLRRRALTGFYASPRRMVRLARALPHVLPRVHFRAPRRLLWPTRALA